MRFLSWPIALLALLLLWAWWKLSAPSPYSEDGE